ncbi:MAG: LicD family protein [Lachnospiraceae bacterium]|nr:LicD family protein [Lachnospiraceae bacterium]
MERQADFFRDEVRNGFYIPTAIKQAWAAQLDVLDVVDGICRKHGIKYFADWGTLLGAVRHGGFVPWDDDLDIAMLRPDYKRFREVADDELPQGFVIHDFERKEDHWLFLARVVNNEKMCFTEEYLDVHNNFPWLAGVDIFLKDYLYKDEEKEKERDNNIMRLLAVADGITDGTMSPMAVPILLSEVEKQYHTVIPDRNSKRDVSVALYKLAEGLMSKTAYDESEKIAQIFPWVLKNGSGIGEPKERYESFIRLPLRIRPYLCRRHTQIHYHSGMETI